MFVFINYFNIYIYIEAVLAEKIEQKVYANQDKSLTNLQTLIMGLFISAWPAKIL